MAWALNAELYLPEAKKLSASMAFTATWLFGFLIVQFRPNIEDAISNSGTYFVFSAGCISGINRHFFWKISFLFYSIFSTDSGHFSDARNKRKIARSNEGILHEEIWN